MRLQGVAVRGDCTDVLEILEMLEKLLPTAGPLGRDIER